MTPAQRAAELLPCRCLDGFHKDTEACPRTHRPAVVSALAEKDKEIEHWKAMYNGVVSAQAEAAALRERVAELEEAQEIRARRIRQLQSRLKIRCDTVDGTATGEGEDQIDRLEAVIVGLRKRLQQEAANSTDIAQAARVEGLRMALRHASVAGCTLAGCDQFDNPPYHSLNCPVGIRTAIDAEIAALERGKEK